MTRIWIVQAEHPSVPGTKIAACASKGGANDQAAEWTNDILRSRGSDEIATAKNWEAIPAWKVYGGAWIEEVELQP